MHDIFLDWIHKGIQALAGIMVQPLHRRGDMLFGAVNEDVGMGILFMDVLTMDGSGIKIWVGGEGGGVCVCKTDIHALR